MILKYKGKDFTFTRRPEGLVYVANSQEDLQAVLEALASGGVHYSVYKHTVKSEYPVFWVDVTINP